MVTLLPAAATKRIWATIQSDRGSKSIFSTMGFVIQLLHSSVVVYLICTMGRHDCLQERVSQSPPRKKESL